MVEHLALADRRAAWSFSDERTGAQTRGLCWLGRASFVGLVSGGGGGAGGGVGGGGGGAGGGGGGGAPAPPGTLRQ